jgi:hypothetical protein
MKNGYVKSNSTFCIRFDGENKINALLLSKAISEMSELTQIAAKEESPEACVELNVTAFKDGSFQVAFSAVVEALPNLIIGATAVAVLAKNVVDTIKCVFEIKKISGDKKPKGIKNSEDDKIIIETESGEKITAPKSSIIIFNNNRVDNIVTNIATYAKQHNPEGSFTFSTESEETSFSTEDLEKMAKSFTVEETITKRTTQVETKLVIKKPDIMGDSKWDFYYENKRISANINDNEWLERLHNREFKIGSGDAINVKLEQYVELDTANIPIENSEKYTVLSVKGDIESKQEPVQMSIH